MKNIEINFSSLKDFFARLGKNLSWLFFGAFLLLLVFEVFEIRQSVSIVLQAGQQLPAVVQSKGIRINFGNYNTAVQRIQNGQTFTPQDQATTSPFGSGQ